MGHRMRLGRAGRELGRRPAIARWAKGKKEKKGRKSWAEREEDGGLG
jgi:hypothetical protein